MGYKDFITREWVVGENTNHYKWVVCENTNHCNGWFVKTPTTGHSDLRFNGYSIFESDILHNKIKYSIPLIKNGTFIVNTSVSQNTSSKLTYRMKKLTAKITLVLLLSLSISSCDSVLKALESANDTMSSMSTITEGEAANGLKEALNFGVNNGTNFLGAADGFLKNAAYKILLPQEVRDVEAKIRSNPIANAAAGPFLDKLLTAMNRGAENAMAEAKPIFVTAIKEMTISDAINIVTGGEGAATSYLKRVTSAQLREKFMPVISRSLEQVNINEPWEKVSTGYNIVTAKNVTTDLNEYVTDKAMDALFLEIRKEEDNIRANPIARTTDLLKKVFAYADEKKS